MKATRRSVTAVALLLLATTAAMLLFCHRPQKIAKHRGAASVVMKTAAIAPPSRDASSGETHGTFRLEGSVIDDMQRPVTSAKVVLLGTDTTATSSEDGTFAFEGLPPHRYRLVASKGELFAPAVTVRLSQTSEPVILRVRRGATLVTHVIADVSPVAGATVTMDRSFDTASGSDGIARIQGLWPGFHYFEVRAEGYAPGGFSMSIGEDPGGTVERTVVLRQGASLSGAVVGPDGALVANARVAIEELGSSSDRWSGLATTDEKGSWKFDALGAGRYSLRASSDVYGPAGAAVLQLDGAAAKTGVMLYLDYNAQIVGRVVDVDGKDVSGCLVNAGVSMSNKYLRRTDVSGHFEFLGIEAGDYDVFCVKGSLSSRSVHVTIANRERAEVRLTVDEGSIAGIVVDSRGDPVAEAMVNATSIESLSTASFGEDTTDSNGRFDLGGLPPGEYFVSATWPGQLELRFDNRQRILTGNRNAKIVLAPPGTVTGRALLDGEPLTYYGLLITETPEFSFMGSARGVRATDGRFRVSGLTPGTWGLVLIGPGTARKIVTGVHVQAGRVTDVGDVTMQHGQVVYGHVLDSRGQPVAGAQVLVGGTSRVAETEMQRWFNGEFVTTTDSSGAYRFGGLALLGEGRPPNIAARHPVLGESTQVPLPFGDALIDLRLAPTGAIDGVVEDRIAEVTLVRAKRVDDPSVTVTQSIDATGHFEFDALAPGDYLVSVAAKPGRIFASTRVTVIAEQRMSVKLRANFVALIVSVVGGYCGAITIKSGETGDIALQECSQGRARFQLAPGNYIACADGDCGAVVVRTSPSLQSTEVGKDH